MALGKVSVLAVKFCCATKSGAKYVTRGTKNLVKNHTPIGKRLRDGVHHAREAVKIKMDLPADPSAGMFERVKFLISEKGEQALINLQKDEQFIKLFEKYKAQRMSLKGPGQNFRRAKIKYEVRETVKSALKSGNPDLSKLNNERFIQEVIETLGVGPTKAAQIIADTPALVKQIEEKFGPKVVEALANTQKKCFPTRTIKQAQEVIDKAFPGQNIKIKQDFGTASIGETYLVTKPDGTEHVIKMIKNGVSKETLNMEENLLSRMAREFFDDPKVLSKYREQLRTVYSDWAKELNFVQEMKNNKLLAQGAKRFRVANITGISDDASCIIMDKANGIQMEKLMEMLKLHKANPAKFATKYAKEIETNPWLANPEKVAKELPSTLLKVFDEQFMFMKKGAQTVMHGDPHKGNFFITADKNGKLIPEFIDTGSCVTRTSAQIKDDINFFSNYFVGNSKGVAEYFVKQCPHRPFRTEYVVEKVAKDIKAEIFGKKHNVRKFNDVQAKINEILERHNLQLPPESTTAMKAQMQFFSNVSDAAKLTGQSIDIITLMKDIPQASLGMAKSGINPWSSVRDAFKFAFHNQKQAMGTAYQFTIKDVDKVLKSDGTLATVA